MNLHSKLSDLARRDEYIAESLNITKQEARELIKSSSFKEYLNLVEANADRGNVGTQTTQSSTSTVGNNSQQMNTPRTPKNAASSLSSKEQKEIEDAIANAANSPTAQNELKAIQDKLKTDPEGAKNDLEDFERRNPTTRDEDGYKKFKDTISNLIGSPTDTFMQGVRKGMAESAELQRIRELAGLTENATTGSTMAGNIASVPSIVGDTSDSHKPSVKLRRNNRLEREEKEKEDAKRKKQKEKEQESESAIERLIKR